MRLIEWIFPVRRYLRLGTLPGPVAPVVIFAVSLVIYWFALHVVLYTSTTAHCSPVDKAIWGLEESVLVLSEIPGAPLESLGDEENVMRMIFLGGMLFTLAAGGFIGWLRLARDGRSGCVRQIARLVLSCSCTWSIFWVVIACLSVIVRRPGLLFLLGECAFAVCLMVLVGVNTSRVLLEHYSLGQGGAVTER